MQHEIGIDMRPTAAFVVVFALLVLFGSVRSCNEGLTDRERSRNEALTKLVQAGTDPVLARCAVEGDTDVGCSLRAAKVEPTSVSSIRSDELPPKPQVQAQLTPFERQLLGK